MNLCLLSHISRPCPQQAEEDNEQRKRQQQLLMEKLLEQEALRQEEQKVRAGRAGPSACRPADVGISCGQTTRCSWLKRASAPPPPRRRSRSNLALLNCSAEYGKLCIKVLRRRVCAPSPQSPSHKNKRQQQELIQELRKKQVKDSRHVYEGKDGAIEDIITGNLIRGALLVRYTHTHTDSPPRTGGAALCMKVLFG